MSQTTTLRLQRPVVICFCAFLIVLSTRVKAASKDTSDLSVDKTGFLAGEVTSDLGEAKTFEVDAFEVEIIDGHSRLIQRCTVTTDPSSRYFCSDLRQGRYIIAAHRVEHPERTSCAHSESVAFVTTFYPGTVDIDAAVKVLLKPGYTTVADIRQHSVEAYTLEGTLPADARQVSLSLSEGHADGYNIVVPNAVHYDPDRATFCTVGLPRGKYSLHIEWIVNTSNASSSVHHKTVRAALSYADVKDLHVDDSSVYSIEGTLSPESNTVGSHSDEHGRVVFVSQADGAEIGAAVSPDGAFALRDIPAGLYGLKYESDQGAYVKDFALNGRIVYDQRLVVPEGPGNTLLSITTHSAGATVGGSLRNWYEEGVEGEIVARSQAGYTYTARTNSQGQFSITDLPPGDYDLYGWEHIGQVEYGNPDVLRRFKSMSTRISVADGHNLTNVQLEILPPDI